MPLIEATRSVYLLSCRFTGTDKKVGISPECHDYKAFYTDHFFWGGGYFKQYHFFSKPPVFHPINESLLVHSQNQPGLALEEEVASLFVVTHKENVTLAIRGTQEGMEGEIIGLRK